MRNYLPSRLDLKHYERSLQLQFTGGGFELVLFERGHPIARPFRVSAGQLRNVSIDLRPVDLAGLRLLYLGRHISVEMEGKSWARVPDVTFLRLIDLAIEGHGTGIDLTQAS